MDRKKEKTKIEREWSGVVQKKTNYGTTLNKLLWCQLYFFYGNSALASLALLKNQLGVVDVSKKAVSDTCLSRKKIHLRLCTGF